MGQPMPTQGAAHSPAPGLGGRRMLAQLNRPAQQGASPLTPCRAPSAGLYWHIAKDCCPTGPANTGSDRFRSTVPYGLEVRQALPDVD